jgi:hypothetical protein
MEDDTDTVGYACFWVSQDQEYSISVTQQGFKHEVIKGIYLGTSTGTSTAYVQIKLKLSGESATVY